MPKEIFTKVITLMAKQTDKDLICIQIECNTKEIGRMISIMDREWNLGLKMSCTKETLRTGREMARELLNMLMEVHMKVNSNQMR